MSAGADQTGRPRRCGPLASVAQAQRKVPMHEPISLVLAVSEELQNRCCSDNRVHLIPCCHVVCVLQAALCHLGCRHADILVNYGWLQPLACLMRSLHSGDTVSAVYAEAGGTPGCRPGEPHQLCCAAELSCAAA